MAAPVSRHERVSPFVCCYTHGTWRIVHLTAVLIVQTHLQVKCSSTTYCVKGKCIPKATPKPPTTPPPKPTCGATKYPDCVYQCQPGTHPRTGNDCFTLLHFVTRARQTGCISCSVCQAYRNGVSCKPSGGNPPSPVTAKPPSPVTVKPPSPVTAKPPSPVTAKPPSPVSPSPPTKPPVTPKVEAGVCACTGSQFTVHDNRWVNTGPTSPWSTYKATFVEKKNADVGVCRSMCSSSAVCVGYSFMGRRTFLKRPKPGGGWMIPPDSPSLCRNFVKQDNSKWRLTATVPSGYGDSVGIRKGCTCGNTDTGGGGATTAAPAGGGTTAAPETAVAVTCRGSVVGFTLYRNRWVTTTATSPWSAYKATFVEKKGGSAFACHLMCWRSSLCVGYSFMGKRTFLKRPKPGGGWMIPPDSPSLCRNFVKQDNSKWTLTATVPAAYGDLVGIRKGCTVGVGPGGGPTPSPPITTVKFGAGTPLVATTAPEVTVTTCRKPVDVLFLLDGSGSIGQGPFVTMKDFTAKVSKAFDVAGGSRVGAVTFGTSEKTQFSPGQHANNAAVEKAINGIGYPSARGTGTKDGLEYLYTKFLKSGTGGVRPKSQGITRVVVVITDGASSSGQHPGTSAHTLREMGVVVFAIGVKGYQISELNAMASSPWGTHVSTIEDWKALSNSVQQVARQICSVVNEHTADVPTTTSTAAPSSAGSCYSMGDPHFKTFGGQTYDFYGVGLYSLLDTEQVTIQPLHVRAGRASANTGVAFLDKATGDVVKFTASSGNVIIGGSCFSAGTGCSVNKPKPFIAVWTHSSGITVTVRTFPGWIPMNIYVDIKAGALDGPNAEAATGLCISSSATQQVPREDSVYSGLDDATSNPKPGSYTPNDGCGHTPGLLAKAQAACANAGNMAAACVKDVCATGDVGVATVIECTVSDITDLAAGNPLTMGQVTSAPAVTTTAAPSSAGSCYSVGDPHFKTFGGQNFDFYGVGLYSLLDTEQVAIQPLHVRAGRASANTGVAFLDKASGDVVKFTASSAGTVVVTGTCSSAAVCTVTTPKPFIAVWTHSSGITVTVRTFPGWIPMNIYVDIKAGALDGPKGEAATGLCISLSHRQQVPESDSVYAGINYATSNPKPSSYTSDDGCGHAAGLLAKAQAACANVNKLRLGLGSSCIKDVCATGDVGAATIIEIAGSDIKDLAAGSPLTMGQVTSAPAVTTTAAPAVTTTMAATSAITCTGGLSDFEMHPNRWMYATFALQYRTCLCHFPLL